MQRGGDGGQHQDDDEDGPEAEGFGHEAADVAVHAAHSPVDGGDDAHGGAEDAGVQVFAEDDVGEGEDGAGDALEEPAGDEQRQRGGGDAEEGAGAHDAEDQEQGGAAADEVAPASDHRAGDGAGEEEHGLHGGGAVGAQAEGGGDLRQRRGDHAGVELEGQHAEQQGGNEQGGAAAGELWLVCACFVADGGWRRGGDRGWAVHIKLLCSAGGVLPLGCELLYNHV